MATPSGTEHHSRKPMYEDQHASCSVLLAKIRNEDRLLCLPPHQQFRWLHRFYLILDRIAEQHRVYKLYGGPHGFMMSTGVAEADPDHAATLLRFALHMLQAAQSIRLPGGVPMDLVMVLASGPASSGLLGTTSLTYQVMGRCVSVARELMDTQQELPFILTGGMFAELKPAIAHELAPMGSVPLRVCPGEEEQLYTLPRFAGLRVTVAQPQSPGAAPQHAPAAAAQPASLARQAGTAAGGREDVGQLPQQQEGAAGPAQGGAPLASPPVPQPPLPEGAQAALATSHDGKNVAFDSSVEAAWLESPGTVKGCDVPAAATPQEPALQQGQPQIAATVAAARLAGLGVGQAAADGGRPEKEASVPSSDLLLRYEDPALEAEFARYNGEAQRIGELAWLLLGLVSATFYALAWTGAAPPPTRLLTLQLLPLAGGVLAVFRRDAYIRWREALWFAQRLLLLLSTSLPGSFMFTQPGAAPMFAYGLGNIGLEALVRRLRLHTQLLSSLVLHAATLTLMHLHPEGSAGRTLLTPGYLSLHFLVTVVVPVAVAASSDYLTRLSFQQRLRRGAADDQSSNHLYADLQKSKQA